MTKSKQLDKFEKLVSEKPSNFLTKFEYQKANKIWLDKSSKIAVSVLDSLKIKGWSQKKLAEIMQVSPQHINKIVKGQENLTIETISKLEFALKIKLVDVFEVQSVSEILTNSTQILPANKAIESYTNPLLAQQVNDSEYTIKESTKLKVAYNKRLLELDLLPTG